MYLINVCQRVFWCDFHVSPRPQDWIFYDTRNSMCNDEKNLLHISHWCSYRELFSLVVRVFFLDMCFHYENIVQHHMHTKSHFLLLSSICLLTFCSFSVRTLLWNIVSHLNGGAKCTFMYWLYVANFYFSLTGDYNKTPLMSTCW